MLDLSVMLVFGVLGYLFKKLDYPLAPLVLALVLGDMAESSFRQAMLLSDGSLTIFWSNPAGGRDHEPGIGAAASGHCSAACSTAGRWLPPAPDSCRVGRHAGPTRAI